MSSGALTAALLAGWLAGDGRIFACTQGSSNDFVSIFWSQRQIPVRIREGHSTTIPADRLTQLIRASFDAWSGAQNECTDLEFVFQEPAPDDPKFDELPCDFRSADKASFDQTIGLPAGSEVILTHDSECWRQNQDPAALAVTTMTYSARDGIIKYGMIELNERDPVTATEGFPFAEVPRNPGDCSVDYDFASVLTHEVGHFIGLAHANPGAADPPTMTAVVERCDSSFATLAKDDVIGLCYIYPRGQEPRQCLPLPEQENYIASVPFGCQAAPGPGGLAALALLALAWGKTCSKVRSGR